MRQYVFVRVGKARIPHNVVAFLCDSYYHVWQNTSCDYLRVGLSHNGYHVAKNHGLGAAYGEEQERLNDVAVLLHTVYE